MAGAGWFYRDLRKSLPRNGTVSVDGLGASVSIRRDAHGVPYIDAKTDNDAFFAAGYVHAQDRLWQLELQRRMVNGRLSEVFGRTSLNNDIWLRTLGLQEAARQQWTRLTPQAQQSLTAYSAGINAFLAEKHELPAEFKLLGVTPEPWTVYDSLAWNQMFALTLGGNFREEISRFVAAQYLPQTKLAALYPGYPADAPLTVTTAERQAQSLLAVADLQQQLESRLKIGGKYVGSNGWVVSGKLTRDGQPILANDPHLALQMPSLWYALRMKGDRLDVAGMTLVGLPVVIFGENGDVAWGGTNMMADQQDLYFERVNPQNPTQYEVAGRWEKFSTRSEEIQVRNEFPAFLRGPLKPVTVEVRSTRHGPVISDQFRVFDEAVALRWTAYDNTGSSYEGFYRVNYARDWQTFNAAFADYVAPALNLLYSDRQGNIGYVGVGRIPLRARGEGTLPVPGWNDDYGWTGSIPFAEMPRSFNPEKGFIINANNRITAPDYPYFISHGWAPETRAARIQELLRQKAADHKLTVADMEAIQGDVSNQPSRALVKVLATVGTRDDRQREAIRTLQQWNGDMDRNSVGAALYYAWTHHLREAIFADELQGPWNQRDKTRHIDSLDQQLTDDQLAALLRHDPLSWCDDKQTADVVEPCEMAMSRSLRKSLRELEKTHGTNMARWTWGALHETRYEHTPFSQINTLRRVFERRVPNGGAPNSVNVASASFRDTEGYVQTFGAGFRQIISLGGHEQHLYMNSTGQSGNVMSAHYDDMVVPFRDVSFYPLPRTAPPAGTATLTLKPRS
ncbi:MAG TPA: penicillin acylase family protein [Thermoanaerobaculia bacterium]|jgi:penicillin amidase|nr:penicillin acylase family protein [Thermoanaerobaculia bacterium]